METSERDNWGSSQVRPAPPEVRSQKRLGGWFRLLAIGLTGGLLSVGGALAVHQWDQEALQVDFERRTGNLMAFLQSDIAQDYAKDSQLMLQSLRDSIVENGLNEDSIQAFRSNATESDLLVSCIFLAPRVPASDLPEFVSDLRRRTGKQFNLHDFEGRSVKRGAIESPTVYYPIVDVAAKSEKFQLLGMNLAMSASAATALDSTIDRENPLLFSLSDDEGLLTFFHLLPIAEGVPDPFRPSEEFEGFVGVATFLPVRSLSQTFPLSMGGIDTYLMAAPNPGRRLISGEDAESADPSTHVRASVIAEHGLAGGARIDMGGIHWIVVSAPRQQLYTLHDTSRPLYTALLILLLTALVLMGTVRVQKRTRLVNELVELRTCELSVAIDDLAREVSERKKTETALLQSQEMYELLSKNVSDVIWTTDMDMQLNYISPSVRHLRGYTADEARQQSIDEILTPVSLGVIAPAIAEAISRVETGEVDPTPSYTLELEMNCRDGGVIRTETTASVLLNSDKQIVGFLGVTRDIEARKRAEEETATLESHLRQSQKMEAIGTLAGGVAHDFNNLLTGIVGYANLLKLRTNEESPTYEAADVIEKAAERASDLTKQLLGFARQGKLQNSAVDLHAMIGETVALLRRTIDKSINIVQRMDAPDPEVMGDPSQIQLVLLNLAVNARDAMAEGGDLTIETENIMVDDGAHPDLIPGNYVCLRISDTGEGIPKEIRERIFEPFFTTKSRGEGTGMGLATVYGIAKNHGGLVTVESTPGLGTTFQVLLPVTVESAKLDDRSDSEPPVHGRGKILVVEDEEVVRKLATDILGWLGYETVTACDGVEAVEYYSGHNDDIDLALIDINMPRMGGRECYQRMKEINPALRAVLSTGYSRDGAAQEILDDGIQGFVQKPFQASQLSEAIALAMK